MNSKLKRALSASIALILLFTLFIPALAEPASQKAVPTIYITGQAPYLLTNDDGQVASCGEVPDGYITEAIDVCLPYLSDAIFNNEWDAYYEELVSWISPLYEEVRLNEDGEPDNGTGINPQWYQSPLPKNIRSNYSLSDYNYCYDWRLDPCYNADTLNEYIQAVKLATDSDKVNIIARCEGACVLNAYLAEYGYGDVNRLVYYTAADGGVDGIGEALSGELSLNSAGLERWAATTLSTFGIEDEFLAEFLEATIIAAENTGMLKLLGFTVEEFYEMKLKQVLPEIILASYGTMPSVYAMADSAYGEKMVDFVFEGKEEEYAGLIEKIENYHTNVSLKHDELLLAAKADGVDIGVIAKYGYATKPVGDTADEIGDGACTLKGLSKGATTAKAGEQLSRKYIAQAKTIGTFEYISPDLQVDASTCLFKDTTWFIKYVEHRSFPGVLDRLIETFLKSEECFTVDTDSAYPRYMIYDTQTGSLSAMTEVNSEGETWDSYTSVGYFTSIIKFFRLLYKLISDFFDSILRPATAVE